MKIRDLLCNSIFALIVILLATNVFAADRQIHAEWTKYVPPVGAVTKNFELYSDGALACTFTGADIISGDCTVSLVKLSTPFTLVATFTDGKKSPSSAPFVFTDYGPGPQGLKVTIVTVTTISKLNKNGRPTSTTTVKRSEAKPGQVVKEGGASYRNSRGEWVTNTTLVM